MRKDAAQTQVAWALLTEAASEARLEAHRLRHLATRAMKMVEDSPEKDYLYQIAGDIVQAVPRRLDGLDRTLDRLSYALSVLGTDHLRERLPMTDRALVDEAVHKARPFHASLEATATRVAYRWLQKQADLNPQLGFPGGPCQVIYRINEEVKDPKLREELIEDVERGMKLTNRDAAKIYDLERDPGGGMFSKLLLTAHAQYRMDQRHVAVPQVRAALKRFTEQYERGKPLLNQNVKKKSLQVFQSKVRAWDRSMQRKQPIDYKDNQLGLFIAFIAEGTTARLVTTYWIGQSDPKPMPEEACPAILKHD